MRIVIDMQGAQTDSRFRGIGRYTLSFAKAVVENSQHHQVFLVLNGLFTETLEPIRTAFQDLLPQTQILVWEVPGPLSATNPKNQAAYDMAKQVRHAFIANLQPDVVHLSSLFEGYTDNAVAEIKSFGPHVFNSVVLYDLIPFVNQQQYLDPNPNYALFYLNKIEQLKSADACLAISEFAAQEALQHLPVLKGKVTTISTAIDAQFGISELSEQDELAVLAKFEIQHAFVLYTGGADERKNLPRLIQAYAELPSAIRSSTQLVFAGRMANHFVSQLQGLAKKSGLAPHELVLTGFVSDNELLALYTRCHCFVFPSWQEGFGLPALEAMACGAATITSHTSSLPEVVGLEEAMFDPYSVAQISNKLLQTFEDEDFRQRLIAHGLSRSKLFTWKDVALKALHAWEGWAIERTSSTTDLNSIKGASQYKPKMAFVSPLPPVKSGIASYSVMLLPFLSTHYDIELITDSEVFEALPGMLAWPLRSVQWFRENADQYDRVLYQLGNSPEHAATLDLIQNVPGVVMLHDFYLSGLKSWLEEHNHQAGVWTEALYASHGFSALSAWSKDPHQALVKYPVNLEQLQSAKGVLTHSLFSKEMARQWYGSALADSIQVLPLLREIPTRDSREEARKRLGIHSEAKVVCSFGFIDHTKHSKMLLQAWAQSSFSGAAHSQLVFVGQNEGGVFGESMRHSIEQSMRQDQVLITGYVDATVYADYLLAADVAVQLRSMSRGETSAAALDCLAAGLPTIVNAHGSMAELPADVVWQLKDEFSVEDLTLAMEVLLTHGARRKSLSQAAEKYIQAFHAPAHCALEYQMAIENFYSGSQQTALEIAIDIADLMPPKPNTAQVLQWAEAISLNFPGKLPLKRLFLDITATRETTRHTGIERVASSLVRELLMHPPAGFRVEPVHLSFKGGRWHARYATQFACQLLSLRPLSLPDDVVEPQAGDRYVTLDLASGPFVQASQSGLFEKFRQRGVITHALVYDLLPVRLPDVFPPGAAVMHSDWLRAISQLDGALCISKSVKADLEDWQTENQITWPNRRPFSVAAFELGADLSPIASSPPIDAVHLESLLGHKPTGKVFLSVGTLEPRKNFVQTLKAFELLWMQNMQVTWILVGREGWTNLSDHQRKDIHSLIQHLQSHPEMGKRLFWLNDVQDDQLAQLYDQADCLLNASLGEGLGLPLIEAARHGLPLLLTDLPVFKEVAGQSATYFSAHSAESLANAIENWIGLSDTQRLDFKNIQTITWTESASQVLKYLGLQETWVY